MPLSIEHRRVGDVTVVTGTGRIVEGPETAALTKYLDGLAQFGPRFVLNLAGVDYLDSSGVGLLVRYTMRLRNAQGHFKLCALPSKMVEVIKVTRLEGVLETYGSEEDAIAAFYKRGSASGGPSRLDATILCVHASADVQAYVRELLGQAGYVAYTAGNLPDALVLMQAMQPRLLVVSADLRKARDTRTAEKFNALADATRVVEMPPDFARRDAAEAGSALLEQVRAASAP